MSARGGHGQRDPQRLRRALPLLCLVVVAVVALRLPLPDTTGADAPDTAFSTLRARAHLLAICGEPHPLGSAAGRRVAAYLGGKLARLGLPLSPQSTRTRGKPLHNVVARLPGRDSTGAVLINAHHDSRSEGPGAGDNGAAVAALLEVMRALRAGPGLRNDVIALFTDGEEAGLLGAVEFVRNHPWRDDVALVLNYDARGSRGPSLMFETSPHAGALVRAFAAAAPVTVASSLMAGIYQRMPNSTDFTVFEAAGWSGLNFAFIGGYETYHTSLDTVAHLDERSMTHHGTSMLALARRFGDADLAAVAPEDVVYFNPAGAWLVLYGQAWVWPLTVVFCLLLLAIGWRGASRAGVRAGGVGRGAAGWLGAAAATTALAAVAAAAVLSVLDGYRRFPWGNTLADPWVFAALGLGGVALACRTLAAVRARADEVVLGTLCCWMALLLLTTALLPGGSPLLAWPALPCMLALGAGYLRASAADPGPRVGLYAACCIPVITALAPVVLLFFQAMTVGLAAVAMPIVCLVIGLAWPVVQPHARAVARSATAAALVALAVALLTGGGAAATR